MLREPTYLYMTKSLVLLDTSIRLSLTVGCHRWLLRAKQMVVAKRPISTLRLRIGMGYEEVYINLASY